MALAMTVSSVDIKFFVMYTNYNMKMKLLNFIVLAAALSAALPCFAEKEDPLGASMYNEMGIQALNDEALDAALSYFQQAHKLNPGNNTVKKNISVVYYRKGEAEYLNRKFAYAENYLSSAIRYDPDNVPALFIMGDIKYLSQNMDEAKAFWEKVLKLEPDFKYAGELKEKIAQLEKERTVEKEYRYGGMDHFDIRYSKEGAKLSYNVRYYLQEAYRLLGQDFDCRPRYKITVLIYEKKDFEYIGEGLWLKGAGGIYDGKIRLPFIGADFTTDQIRGIIYHEYTHLLVNDISGRKAPRWLDEGLAEYEAARYAKKNKSVLKSAVNSNSLIPLEGLDPVFSDLNNEDAARRYLAYLEAYTLTNYLMKRYNKYKVREVLKELGKGVSLDAVMKNKLNITIDEFERRWLADLKAGKLY
jgi:tetratricopeptide (TPR) repeat protein